MAKKSLAEIKKQMEALQAEYDAIGQEEATANYEIAHKALEASAQFMTAEQKSALRKFIGTGGGRKPRGEAPQA